MNILRHLAASALALLMLATAPVAVDSTALAQQVTRAQSGSTLQVAVSQGQLVRIDKPVSSVFVANSEIADVAVKSPQLIYVFAKKPGTTTIYAVDEGDQILASITLNVTHNLSRLGQTMADLMPGRNINAQSIDGGIVLTGTVATPTESEDARRLAAHFLGANEEVINRLQITSANQVNLRVRIAEVNKQVLRNLGINWNAVFNNGDIAFGFLTGFPLALSNVVAGATGVTGTAPTVNTNNFDLTATLDLLAEEGLVSVLAEPNLTALSGETATFLAGGEFPVPIAQDTDSSGINTITVEFKEFGVSLAFTPTVLSPNRISMRVRPEVSALSQNGAVTIGDLVIPALTVRRAETTIELGSGQSFAIAGLIQANHTLTADEVPGLGDIPILGELFKSDKFQRQETELVILATPYIVQPISNPNAPAMPTDVTTGGEGTQRVAGGATGAVPASGNASGSAGFVIE
jgi:pilus assembly protein CpaC